MKIDKELLFYIILFGGYYLAIACYWLYGFMLGVACYLNMEGLYLVLGLLCFTLFSIKRRIMRDNHRHH